MESAKDLVFSRSPSPLTHQILWEVAVNYESYKMDLVFKEHFANEAIYRIIVRARSIAVINIGVAI